MVQHGFLLPPNQILLSISDGVGISLSGTKPKPRQEELQTLPPKQAPPLSQAMHFETDVLNFQKRYKPRYGSASYVSAVWALSGISFQPQ